MLSLTNSLFPSRFQTKNTVHLPAWQIFNDFSSHALCLWIDGHKTSGSKQGAHSHHSAKAQDVSKGYKTGGGHRAEGGHNDEKGHKGQQGHKSAHHHYYGQRGDTGKVKHVKKSEEKGGNTKSHHDEDSHGAGHDEHENGGHGTKHKEHDKYKKTGFTKVRFMHSILCLTKGPYPLSKRVLLRVRSSVSSYNLHYPLACLRSLSTRSQFLPRLTVTWILLSSFPSTACFRRQILRKLWSIKLAFLLLLYVGYFFPPWLCVIFLHFSHFKSNWSSPFFSNIKFLNFPLIYFPQCASFSTI